MSELCKRPAFILLFVDLYRDFGAYGRYGRAGYWHEAPAYGYQVIRIKEIKRAALTLVALPFCNALVSQLGDHCI